MTCSYCSQFLMDYLPMAIHQNLQLHEKIKHKHMKKITPSLVSWIFHIQQRLQPQSFQEAFANASNIAKRDRSLWDYDFLIHTAMFNFMKLRQDWLADEMEYIKILLVEESFIKSSSSYYAMKYAQDYIAYILPKSLLQLGYVHKDHLIPKGIQTPIHPTPSLTLVDMDEFRDF